MMMNKPLIIQAERELKAQYLDSLRTLGTSAETTRQTVNRLFNYGIPRKTLIEWGVEDGYSLPSMRSLVSKLLTSEGIRTRKPGAGRRSPTDVLEVVDLIRGKYGRERAAGLLRGAYREVKAQAAAEKVRIQSLIVVPQLECQTWPVLISHLELKNPPTHQPVSGPLPPSPNAGARAFAAASHQPVIA
jgi:hypothetical protein